MTRKRTAAQQTGKSGTGAASTRATTTRAPGKPAPAEKTADRKLRSGGTVDAPGKQHRKPMPSNPDVKVARAQAAKMRTAMPMEKTSRRRGRG